MLVLGIETSCDETGVAIYDSEQGLLANALYSQIPLHRQYGGVVPELASRDHIKYLVPMVNEALNQASLKKEDLDVVAYTAGPGLVGALLTGACFAKSLAYALEKPAIAIHHLESHILVAMMEEKNLQFPFLSLLVSGGHTQLIYAKALGDYELLGDTLDDAVGEAFDKTAKLMGLPYPGGPLLADLADSFSGSPLPSFPRPMIDRPGLDFSFSGLKTHALSVWNSSLKDDVSRMAIAQAFQSAVVEVLSIKCKRAMKAMNTNVLVVAGGVSANKTLRKAITIMMQELGGKALFPKLDYCTDNGAMVAYAGYLHFKIGREDSNLGIEVKPRWELRDA
jgi:N6-L-threonylcarbamoyladenine synthase